MVPMLRNNFGKQNAQHNKADSYECKREEILAWRKIPSILTDVLNYDSSFKLALEKTLPAR